MAKVIAVMNEKGGVGKSATATTLAYLLAKRGKRTPMINVMMCADSIIVPTQAELLSTQGLAELLRHYQIIRKNSNHKLQIEGILITMDSPNTIVSAQVRQLIERGFAGAVLIFKTHIPRSIKVAEAVLYHKTICEFMPNNPAALAYECFVDELLENEERSVKAVG